MRAVDRRTFCKLVGGGIVVLVTAKPAELFSQQRRGYPEDLNAFLRIDETGRVTLFSGKIEMGQGVHTSLAQMAAEELGVSLDAITVVMGDTDQCPWDAGTWGSQSTRMFGPAVRAAAAEARTVMMKLASEKLGSAREQLVVSNGIVTDGKQSISYGDLAKGKQIARLVDEKAVLRSVKDFKVIGANADKVLELPYDDKVRRDYAKKYGFNFTLAHLSPQMQQNYGGVSVFPTLFFVDRGGTIVKHFVNFQEKPTLEAAIQMTLAK